MKKIVILLLLCATSLSTYAQEKGEKFLSALIGVNVSRSKLSLDNETIEKSDPEITLNMSLGIHSFVAKNFRFGIDAGCSMNKVNEGDSLKKAKMVLVGPVSAYYVTLAEKFYYVPQLGVYFMHTNFTKQSNITGSYFHYGSSDELIKNGFGIEIQPVRFEVRPCKNLGLTMGILSFSFVDLFQKKDELSVIDSAIGLSNRKHETTGLIFDLGVKPEIGVHIFF